MWFCWLYSWGHVPSHCRLLGTMSSVSIIDTHFQVCARNTQHCHPTLKIGGDTFRRIIYAEGVCVFSQSGRVISTETDECSQTTAEWLLLGVTLTEIDERQRRCLVQRTIDTTAKNCNANYSGFSRVPLIIFTTPIIRRPTFACDTWHDVVTSVAAAIFCCFDGRLTMPNESALSRLADVNWMQ